VATHAQTILRFPIKFDVALFAIVFYFGMSLYDLARCHDGFDALRAGCHACERKQHGQHEPAEHPEGLRLCRAPLSERLAEIPHLVGMYCNDMHDGADHQQVDKWNMRHMPQRE